MLSSANLVVGARASRLSRAQVEEVLLELRAFHPEVAFSPLWVETTGDQNQTLSLRTLDKTDFFTKEIDVLLLAGTCRIAIHSAKDLPDPLPQGLALAALTKGVDPSDSLVLRKETLPPHALIGTSSKRRDETIQALRPDLRCVDIRGTIDQRLARLDAGEFDGVVIAEAALIRLKLTKRKRIPLPGLTTPLQGRLAILTRENDCEMLSLFSCL